MAESPFLSDDPRDWQQAPLPAGHPSKALLALRDKIPANPNGLSMTGMARDALGTMANWIGGNPQTKDMIGPTGGAGLMAAGMTKPVANTLRGFIGPAQAARLDLTPGSRGSIGALERAQATWGKGGTDPGALAETWAKEGWAPPSAFGAGDQPFSWLQMPELRIKDARMAQIEERLAGGNRARLTGSMQHILEPNKDAQRLFQAEPSLRGASVDLAVGGKTPWQGYATTHGRWPDDPPDKPARPMIGMQGKDSNKAESALLGHELRGHALPGLGGAQDFINRPPSIMNNTRAFDKLDGDFRRQQIAGQHAAYFADPAEKMARHAQDLHIRERQGQSPFREDRAPGVMSTYGDKAFVDRQMLNEALGLGGDFRMRDFAPLSAMDFAKLRAKQRGPLPFEMAE